MSKEEIVKQNGKTYRVKYEETSREEIQEAVSVLEEAISEALASCFSRFELPEGLFQSGSQSAVLGWSRTLAEGAFRALKKENLLK